MADVPISGLPAAGALDGTELVPVVKGGVTSRTTSSEVSDVVAVLKVPLAMVPKADVSVAYGFVIGDNLTGVSLNNAATITATVPTNAAQPFAIGVRIPVIQLGAGQVTVAAAGGVTITATPGLLLRTQGSVAELWKIGTNTWLLYGDIST